MPSVECREKWDQNQRDRGFYTQKGVVIVETRFGGMKKAGTWPF